MSMINVFLLYIHKSHLLHIICYISSLYIVYHSFIVLPLSLYNISNQLSNLLNNGYVYC